LPTFRTIPLSFFVHRILLHPGMQRYFRKHAPDLVHRRGYGKDDIVAATSKKYRLEMLNQYYNTLHGRRLLDGVAKKWDEIYPNARQHFIP
jgi:hypothetical protein